MTRPWRRTPRNPALQTGQPATTTEPACYSPVTRRSADCRPCPAASDHRPAHGDRSPAHRRLRHSTTLLGAHNPRPARPQRILKPASRPYIAADTRRQGSVPWQAAPAESLARARGLHASLEGGDRLGALAAGQCTDHRRLAMTLNGQAHQQVAHRREHPGRELGRADAGA